MKPLPPRSRAWSSLAVACAGLLLASVAPAKDRMDAPPSPGKVLRDIRGFIHRVGNGVKDAGKQTWGAVRDRFRDDDDDKAPPSSRKTPQRTYSGDGISLDRPPVIRPKEPTRPRGGEEPKPGIILRDTSPGGPITAPKEEIKPAEPEASPAPTETAPAPAPDKSVSTPPKTTEPAGEGGIEFARPVPGTRGLVYPPGAKESDETMVDVSGFTSGQIVRDPRTGKLFRVP